jgi:hypothetical protein
MMGVIVASGDSGKARGKNPGEIRAFLKDFFTGRRHDGAGGKLSCCEKPH